MSEEIVKTTVISGGGAQASGSPTVATPCEAWVNMMRAAALCRTLMGGTRAMKQAGKTYLPQEPAEGTKAYENRLERSVLFNAYKRAVTNLVGKMFKNGVRLTNVPPQIEEFLRDIDKCGRDVERFLRDVTEDAMVPGISFILVDHPPKPDRALSVEEEKKLKLRPHWVHIKIENCFKWVTEVVNGVEVLARLHISETVEEPDGQWGTACVQQIRVLYPGKWETYRLNGENNWVLHESGTTTLDFIPLVPFYTKRTGFMTAEPPLDDLAELNLAHWRSDSDQRHILHVARVPILFGAGFEASDGALEVGSTRMVRNTDPQSQLKYVEHEGKAIGAGREDLKDLEERMRISALEPLIQRSGTITATARALDSAEAISPLQATTKDLEDCLEQCLVYTAAWMRLNVGDKAGNVEIQCDTSITLGTQADLDALDKARERGDISHGAYTEELKRRSVLREDYDAAADKKLIDKEFQDKMASEAPPNAIKDANGNPIKNPDGTWKTVEN